MKKAVFLFILMSAFCLASAVTWNVSLTDDYGDGWNGGSLDVYVNGFLVQDGITLNTGHGPEYFPFIVQNGDQITTLYTPGGWAYENAYFIYDHDGILIASEGTGGAEPMSITSPIVVVAPVGLPGLVTNPSPANGAVNVAMSGNLTWTFGADTETYDLWFGPAGAMIEVEGGELAGATGSFSYSGLNGYTAYQWQVISHNSNKATTDGPVWSFSTMASPVASFPWTEDFEGTFLPVGWNKIVNTGNDITQSSSQNHTAGGSYSCRFSSWDYGSNYNQYLFSRPITVTAPYTLLSFWHRKSHAVAEVLEWGIGTNTNPSGYAWTPVTLSNTAWQETEVNLASYAGQTVYIGFHYYGDYLYFVYLDDVNIDQPAGMYPPTVLTVSNLGTDSADLGWTENNVPASTQWDILYGASGFDPDTEGTLVNVTQNPYTLGSLIEGTAYDWYVRSNDGSKLVSVWAGPGTFTTALSPITSYPWIETFEDASPTRIGWTQIQEISDHVWTWAAGAGAGSITTAHSGVLNARFTGSSGWPHVTKLVSPVLDLSAKANYMVSFWYGQEDWGGDQNELWIFYRTSPSSAWVLMEKYEGNVNAWTQEFGMPLPNPTATYQLAFEGVDLYGYPNVLDDIEVSVDDRVLVPGPDAVPGGDVPPELAGPDPGIPALVYTVTATGVHDVIVANPGWGVDWYCWIKVGSVLYAGGNPIPAADPSWTFTGIDFGAKGEAVVVLNDNQTLPVELSSFTATLTAELFVQLDWVAQSETNHLGYNILRGASNQAAEAIRINGAIVTSEDGTQAGTQISYSYLDNEVDTGFTYYYWLESLDLGGSSVLHGPVAVMVAGEPDDPGIPPLPPTVTKLLPAFPNPFNPSTNIRYQLKDPARVRIEIYNVKGQLMNVFENEHSEPGYFQINWDGRDANGNKAASGVYLYRMTAGKYSSSKKMVLAK
jgi:hypothetical protein